jgi:hypothetical protein
MFYRKPESMRILLILTILLAGFSARADMPIMPELYAKEMACANLHEPLQECFIRTSSCRFQKVDCAAPTDRRLYSKPEARCAAETYTKAVCPIQDDLK